MVNIGYDSPQQFRCNDMIQRLTHPARAGLVAITIAIVIAGCGFDSFVAPVELPWTTVREPGVGSLYRFRRNPQDGDGNSTGPAEEVAERVYDTNAEMDGMRGVHFFFEGMNVSYCYYAPTGDLVIDVLQNVLKPVMPAWGNLPLDRNWIILPFRSRASARDTLADIANYQHGAEVVPLLVCTETVFQRVSTYYVGQVLRTTFQVTTTITIDIGEARNTIVAIFNFAPSIGYFTVIDVRVKPSPRSPDFGRGGFLKMLDSVALK